MITLLKMVLTVIRVLEYALALQHRWGTKGCARVCCKSLLSMGRAAVLVIRVTVHSPRTREG